MHSEAIFCNGVILQNYVLNELVSIRALPNSLGLGFNILYILNNVNKL